MGILIRTIIVHFAILFLLAWGVSSCNSTEFAGANKTEKKKTEQAIKQDKPEKVEEQSGNSQKTRSNDEVPDDKDEESESLPETAVVAGSFAAWTEPARPQPFQGYFIVIEVTLPKGSIGNQAYSRSDLTGQLVGTDGYVQSLIAGEKNEGDKFWSPEEKFEVLSTRARLSIKVPGAESLVQDKIQIRSSQLNEQQSLTLIFQ